jgi:hypothetical protein
MAYGEYQNSIGRTAHGLILATKSLADVSARRSSDLTAIGPLHNVYRRQALRVNLNEGSRKFERNCLWVLKTPRRSGGKFGEKVLEGEFLHLRRWDIVTF